MEAAGENSPYLSKKNKKLADGSRGSYKAAPRHVYGALLLSCNEEICAWPMKYSTRLVVDQFDYVLATEKGFDPKAIWDNATIAQKIARYRRYLFGPENPAHVLMGKVVSNEMKRLPRVATAVFLQQESMKKAAADAGILQWRYGLHRVSAVDECDRPVRLEAAGEQQVREGKVHVRGL